MSVVLSTTSASSFSFWMFAIFSNFNCADYRIKCTIMASALFILLFTAYAPRWESISVPVTDWFPVNCFDRMVGCLLKDCFDFSSLVLLPSFLGLLLFGCCWSPLFWAGASYSAWMMNDEPPFFVYCLTSTATLLPCTVTLRPCSLMVSTMIWS